MIRLKNTFQVFLVLFISFWGVVTHAMLASGYVDALLAGRVDEPVLINLPENFQGSEHVSRYGIEGNQGAYNSMLTLCEDGAYRYKLKSVFPGGMDSAYTLDADRWGLFSIVEPFFIPFGIHIFVVFMVRFILGLDCWRKPGPRQSRFYCSHLLYSSVYAYLVMICFQSARMLWANEMVGVGAYLNHPQIGNLSLYILLGMCILMYLYCVIGTARLQVRRRPNAKSNTCIGCGYTLDGIDGNCPECDLEAGAYVKSKLRINHWYLAAMFVITFLSPVLVASVHGVIW